MSNFNCEHCGAMCCDSPNGYTTGCEHYPPDVKQVKEVAIWFPDDMDEEEKQACLESFRNATGKFIPLRSLRDKLAKKSIPLAKRLFEIPEIEHELECEVSKALGFAEPDSHDNDILDYGWDAYDGSVEIVRKEGSQFMAREQANKILDLGFYMIFESIGDQCKVWTKQGEGSATARKPSEKQVPKIKPLVWDSAESTGMKLLRASNPIVQFEMFATSKKCKVLMFGRNYKKKKDFDTESEAKAWCQAEYERRVRECLE